MQEDEVTPQSLRVDPPNDERPAPRDTAERLPLDQLASLARTALTDPNGLPDEEWASDAMRATDFSPRVTAARATYAVTKLDEIINAINPAEWTRENTAVALRVLGRHVAEIKDALRGIAEERGEEAWRSLHYMDGPATRHGYAADQIDTALDYIDNAIRTLEDEEDDAPQAA